MNIPPLRIEYMAWAILSWCIILVLLWIGLLTESLPLDSWGSIGFWNRMLAKAFIFLKNWMVRGFEARIPAAGLRNFTLALRPLNLSRLSIPETPMTFLNMRNPIATRKK